MEIYNSLRKDPKVHVNYQECYEVLRKGEYEVSSSVQAFSRSEGCYNHENIFYVRALADAICNITVYGATYAYLKVYGSDEKIPFNKEKKLFTLSNSIFNPIFLTRNSYGLQVDTDGEQVSVHEVFLTHELRKKLLQPVMESRVEKYIVQICNDWVPGSIRR